MIPGQKYRIVEVSGDHILWCCLDCDNYVYEVLEHTELCGAGDGPSTGSAAAHGRGAGERGRVDDPLP